MESQRKRSLQKQFPNLSADWNHPGPLKDSTTLAIPQAIQISIFGGRSQASLLFMLPREFQGAARWNCPPAGHAHCSTWHKMGNGETRSLNPTGWGELVLQWKTPFQLKAGFESFQWTRYIKYIQTPEVTCMFMLTKNICHPRKVFVEHLLYALPYHWGPQDKSVNGSPPLCHHVLYGISL